MKVFQTAIGEALKYKQSGGDALSEMLDLLSDPKKVKYTNIFSFAKAELTEAYCLILNSKWIFRYRIQ